MVDAEKIGVNSVRYVNELLPLDVLFRIRSGAISFGALDRDALELSLEIKRQPPRATRSRQVTAATPYRRDFQMVLW
jgi:hypothetical protein